MIRSTRLFFAAALVLASAAISTATERIGRALDGFVGAVLEVLGIDARDALAALVGVPESALCVDGDPVDAATQQSLRHEAGFDKRAAARKV